MHLPDAILSGPVTVATVALGAGGLGLALRRLGRAERNGPSPVVMGMTAAFLFAAQMVNFPVLPGVSGHLLGGVLAAVMLGPWGGAVVLAAVLLVQALLFADGGVTALGANFVNMGLLGAGVGWLVYASVRRRLGGRRGILVGAMAAAWLSVLLSAGACAVQLAASGRWSSFGPVLGWMLLVHAAIGVGEALITGVVVQAVLRARPDLIPDPDAEGGVGGVGAARVQAGLAGLAVALAVAMFLGPLAWDWPDGLEWVGERVGVTADEAAAPVGPPAPMPDYQLRLPGVDSLRLATAAAGAVGTLVVFAAAAGLARALEARPRLATAVAGAGDRDVRNV
jgi:cobalt/nickel transport system permease protein